MPIDHAAVVVPQSKLDELVAFLLTSLSHLGFKEIMRPAPHAVGLGDVAPFFWLTGVEDADVDAKTLELILKKTHVAFTAEKSADVDTFHAAAVKAGGVSNGEPGPRPHYHPGYYGAFVHDPILGINFEVVCHKGAS